MNLRQMLRQLPVVAVLAMPLLPGTVQAAEPVSRWHGFGTQQGASWTILLEVEEGRHRISYPSLCCGGRWEPVDADDNSARFIERLEYGSDRCIDDGLVTLTDFGDTLHYSYAISEEAGQMASGVLHPAGSAGAKAALQQKPDPVLECKSQPIS